MPTSKNTHVEIQSAITLPRGDVGSERKWSVADLASPIVLLWYTVIVAFAVLHHEPWSDEAEAWLIARDLPFGKMLAEMHYEGSPALWHSVLWAGIHGFRLPYVALNWIAAAGAVAGIAILLFWAPFPRYLRYGLAFSFYLVYQYAAIARPYAFVPLLAFLAVHLYRKQQRPLLLAVVLVLLAHLSLYSAIIAGAIAASYSWHAASRWKEFSKPERTKHVIAALVVAIGFFLVVITAYPAADCKGLIEVGSKRGLPSAITAIGGALVDSLIASTIILVLLGIWCYRRQQFVLFLLSVGGTVAFLGWGYGLAHHFGMITIAAVVSAWAAWPNVKSHREGKLQRVLPIAAMAIVCAVQIGWATVAISADLKRPYTGAADAAKYLQSVNAQQEGVNACDYSAVAIQPYFERNIFRNWPTADGAAFYHHSGRVRLDDARQCLAGNPRYIVVVDWQGGQREKYERSLGSIGYSLVHYSPGQMSFQLGVEFFQNYLIFRRDN